MIFICIFVFETPTLSYLLTYIIKGVQFNLLQVSSWMRRTTLDKRNVSFERSLQRVVLNCTQTNYLEALSSISSTFYAHIFCVCSKPNSKQRKAAQKTFVWKMRE